MSVKYYMQFVLHEQEVGPAHYSGVVEVEHNIHGASALDEIEEMLADNFECEANDVRVIHYARLH